MPSLARDTAISWPPNPGGPHSATITWKLLFFAAAAFRNCSTVCERPTVRITSLAWMCSRACVKGEGENVHFGHQKLFCSSKKSFKITKKKLRPTCMMKYQTVQFMLRFQTMCKCFRQN